ncbi:unnamed protein product [Rangifer tarandus platyrhynchus]|uniref:Uncharacterized protein n=2 Tax=Rangifer tarandus platyrhynchus TaxID=3082113 RepID=A0AC59Y5C0_RANTA|nr:unnamed protein product [Rangifer tarandus platyrhynchus]
MSTYCTAVLVAKSCPTLCNLMDCSPPGSSVHGISQAAILEWVAISFSSVRKPLTRGFLCAVLDLLGTLWPLLIPEYSGIKRRGTPFPGLRNPGISHYSDKYPLPFYELNGKR